MINGLRVPRRQLVVASLVGGLTCLLVTNAFADPAKASITVVEKFGSDTGIAGVSVVVYKNPTSNYTPAYKQSETTDAKGRAYFGGLETNGSYLVQISKRGCSFPSQDQNIQVPNNKSSVKKQMRLDCP